MSYTDSLQKILEERSKREAEKQKNALEARRIAIEEQKVAITAKESDAKARLLDKQSQKTEEETIRGLTEQELATNLAQGRAGWTGKSGAFHKKPPSSEEKKKKDLSNIVSDLIPKIPTLEQISKDPGNPQAPQPSQKEGDSPVGALAGGSGESELAPPTSPGGIPGTSPQGSGVPSAPTFERPKGTSKNFNALRDRYIRSLESSANKTNKLFAQSAKERKEAIKNYERITNNYQKASDQSRKDLRNVQRLRRDLAENPVQRDQALANIGWPLRIGSVVHAMMQGYLQAYGIGTDQPQLIDELIENEFNDLLISYNEQKDALSHDENLIKMNMDMLQDEQSAKLATLLQLTEWAQDGLNEQVQQTNLQAVHSKNLLDIEATAQKLNNDRLNIRNALQQQTFENRLKIWEAKQPPEADFKTAIALSKEQREERKYELEHTIDFHNPTTGKDFKYEMSKDMKKSTDKAFVSGQEGIALARQLQDSIKGLSLKNWLLSKTAIVSKAGKRAQAVFDTVRKTKIFGKMTFRKDVAGGQVAVAEHAIMDDMLNISRFKFGQVISKLKGGEKTLVIFIKRRAVEATLAKILSTPIGKQYMKEYGRDKGKRRLFIDVGLRMGLKRDELRETKHYLR